MSGRVSSLADRLRERPLHGTFLKLPAAEVVEIVAESLDFAVVDLEHSQLSEGDALRLVRHAWALGFPVVVRLHELDRALVNRLLEAGASGIQLSSVRSAAEVRALREACLYAPVGTRSVSLAHGPARYGGVGLADYVASVEAPLLVAQIETRETDDPLDEILAAGVDVAFVGVTDLTLEYELDAQRVRARVDEVAAAADAAGVAFGGFGEDHRYRYAIASSDLALLRKAYAGD